MLASRLLGAAAARVIFFFCSRTSKIVFERLHHEVAMLSCQQVFAIWAFVIFPCKVHVRKGFIFFRALAPRSSFGAAISDAVARSSLLLCNSVPADRNVMLASRLFGAAAACVILLCLCSWTL